MRANLAENCGYYRESLYYGCSYSSLVTCSCMQTLLVASCLGHDQLVEACQLRLAEGLVSANTLEVQGPLGLAIIVNNSPGREVLRGILCSWMQHTHAKAIASLQPCYAQQAVKFAARNMRFAIENGTDVKVDVSTPGAEYSSCSSAPAYVLCVEVLHWLCEVATKQCGMQPGSLLLPAFVQGFNLTATRYQSKTYQPGPGFSNEPASFANCILVDVDVAATLEAERLLATLLTECLEYAASIIATDWSTSSATMPEQDVLSHFIDRCLPAAYQITLASLFSPFSSMSDHSRPTDMLYETLSGHSLDSLHGGEVFLRLAAWLLDSSDPMLELALPPTWHALLWPQGVVFSVIPFSRSKHIMSLTAWYIPECTAII